MPIARSHGSQPDNQSDNRPDAFGSTQSLRSRPVSGFRPLLSKIEYQPPTPTSLINSSTSDSESSAISTADCSTRSDPLKPAHLPHRSPHLSLLYQRRHPGDASQGEAKKCPVCLSRNCRLLSHKLYASRRKGRQSQRPQTADKPPQTFLTASISNAPINPFFDLPIGKSDPEMHQHFRDFFTAQSSTMASPVRVLAFDAAYYPILLPQALADPALCYTFIAMAATYSAIHGRDLRAPDAKLLSIYGRILNILRQQIGQARQSRNFDTAIMTTNQLLMCYGFAFNDKSAIVAYSAALKNLVVACGGLSNLQAQSVALTLWGDLYATLYTGKKPVFLEQARVVPDIPLSNPPAAVYGSALGDLRSRGLLSQSLLDVCVNTCRLVELLEDRVSGNTNTARWEYFNYKRNAMAIRNGIVYSEFFGTGTKAECISLAQNLFLFLVLRLMPWKAPFINLCERLQAALLASGLHECWGQDIDVLLWVLYTLLAGAEYGGGKQWALERLLGTLCYRYRSEPSKWPPDWCEMQRLNLLTFTWSKIYLTESFNATCHALAAMSQGAPPSPASHTIP